MFSQCLVFNVLLEKKTCQFLPNEKTKKTNEKRKRKPGPSN
jgi:hypothetical protein